MDIGQLNSVQKVISRIKAADNRVVKIAGTWGSFAPLLALHIHQELKKPILYIGSHLDDADNVVDDLIAFGGRNIETLGGRAGEELIDATDEISAARARLVLKMGLDSSSPYRRRLNGDEPQPQRSRLNGDEPQPQRSRLNGNEPQPQESGLNGDEPRQSVGGAKCGIISTSIQALMQPVPRPERLLEKGLALRVGEIIEMERVCGWLVDNGFEAVAKIDLPGQFVKRGGIIDIFAPVTTQSNQPIAARVEFFGDKVESIRTIDLDTQRSSGNIEEITITSAIGDGDGEDKTLFLNVIDPETIIFVHEPTDVQEIADVFVRRVERPEGLYKWEEIYKRISDFKQVHISRFADDADNIELKIKSTQQFEHKSGPVWAGHRTALQQLTQMAQEGWDVYLYCETGAEVKRIEEIIGENNEPRHSDGGAKQKIHLPIGFVHRGFIIEELKTIVATHHELFGQAIIRRTIRPIGATTAVDSAAELSKGDYVVHINYGIGKFKGIEAIEKDGNKCEFLTLQYADKALVHIPVQNIGFVQKYIGTTAIRPKLSKIGTKKWERQKNKVASAVADLASELLEIQARRQSMKGIAYGEDSNWQREFEESFLYQETPDQEVCSEQIKADMKKAVPMDRLLCGDVGYGKTELAMRAAFKAIEAGKQVAVLVPTTVLCIQHERTFTQRFADFPISVESINRFKTKQHSAEIVKRAKEGKVDILIGTHRLLSNDVGFKDLGLLIIDEEQRFGVEHKEKLKKMRVNVDILTMTATPIPRTLHMAMLGLRDISSLTTPPLDRRAVVTQVKKFDAEIIKRAILFELNRQGQIFFVHNRVQTIEKFADEIKKLVPDVKIAIAHGQMHKHELEKAMIKFVIGEIDVLLCSAIIESGIDIPNANTIIINDADRFGLAQLHQLRGRVGRFKHRAHAYFLLPRTRSITPVAIKRLKAIEEYSQLGAGFKIALRDLEIRGAGNILGPEQSGHINTIGFELFCRLLAEAVKRLRKEPLEKEPSAVIDLGFSVYIPRSYIQADSQRMNVYRRIAAARVPQDIARLEEELGDMFGRICPEVQKLLELAEIRILASAAGIRAITISGDDVVFALEKDNAKRAMKIFTGAPGKVRIPDALTVYIRFEKNYLGPDTICAVLRKILRKKT
ncbi:MAG: transcription-repair coupling factor [Sedimentisphaerales bacterium]|nr:transcription-repair coupling factor [Sedimentisphaerales bacterium]